MLRWSDEKYSPSDTSKNKFPYNTKVKVTAINDVDLSNITAIGDNVENEFGVIDLNDLDALNELGHLEIGHDDISMETPCELGQLSKQSTDPDWKPPHDVIHQDIKI